MCNMFRPGNEVGIIGENIATMFLMKQGFSIQERNYWKKWGEIDIVCQKDRKTHFVEVKSVSCENLDTVFSNVDAYRPEENVHKYKLARLYRTIESYLMEKGDTIREWQIDIAVVYIQQRNKKSKIKMIENVI